MTITISLDPVNEQRLRDAAKLRGVEIDALAAEMMIKALASDPAAGGHGDRWTSGLNAGRGWISDDFTSPLPDSFWLGEA